MRKEPEIIKNSKIKKACQVSCKLDLRREDIKLSLKKCSEKTRFRSSLFDMLAG